MKKTTPSPRKTAAKSAPKSKPAARRKAAPPKPAPPRAGARSARPEKIDPQRALIEKVRAILDAKKGENISVLHVADVSSVADYMILCTGLNIPHLRALADEVAKQLRLLDPPRACHRRAGSTESQWLVLDYIDFIVHLFTPATRSYYAIEQLWKDAPLV